MEIQFRKIGTTLLAALATVALSAPKALAQEATDPTAPAPLPFHFDLSTAPAADDSSAPALTFMDQGKSSHHEGFGFGIKGGFIFKSLQQSPIDGATLGNKTGETIGIFFGGNRPGRFGVMGELMYNTRKGIEPNTDTLSIHSLEIPILFRINIGSQSLKGGLVYILFGPAADLQLSAGLLNETLTKNYKGLNIDAIFGGGIEITRFFVEGREDIALKGVNDGNLGNLTELHTKSFVLLFGFRIN